MNLHIHSKQTMQFHFTQDILKVFYCLFWLAINLMKQGSKFLSRVRLHSLPGVNDTWGHPKPPSYQHKRLPVTEPGVQKTGALMSLVPHWIWPCLALQDPHPKEWFCCHPWPSSTTWWAQDTSIIQIPLGTHTALQTQQLEQQSSAPVQFPRGKAVISRLPAPING